jgi:hypothetical protein
MCRLRNSKAVGLQVLVQCSPPCRRTRSFVGRLLGHRSLAYAVQSIATVRGFRECARDNTDERQDDTQYTDPKSVSLTTAESVPPALDEIKTSAERDARCKHLVQTH